MYNAKTILFACMAMVVINANAQYAEIMRPMRPGMTVKPWTVGDKVFQVHLGVQKAFNGRAIKYAVWYNNIHTGDLNLCYGLGERFELDANTSLRKDDIEFNHAPIAKSGLNLASFGARYNIHDGGLNGVSVGLQALAKLPVQSQDYRVNKVMPKVLLLLGWNPSNIVTLTGNIGIEYDGINDNPTIIYSIASQFFMTKNLGSFIEVYNTQAYAYEHFDLGLFYLVNHDFQIDISGGYGGRRFEYDTFISLGLSYRFAANRNVRHRWVYGEYR